MEDRGRVTANQNANVSQTKHQKKAPRRSGLRAALRSDQPARSAPLGQTRHQPEPLLTGHICIHSRKTTA